MPCCCNVHLHTLIILKEPYRPPACMLTDCGGLFSEFFVILYLFRLYGGNAQLPCLLLMDDFAAAIACIVICFVRMARLPSPQLGLLLDGLTSYPLPCLTLPVRWGSDEPTCQSSILLCRRRNRTSFRQDRTGYRLSVGWFIRYTF